MSEERNFSRLEAGVRMLRWTDHFRLGAGAQPEVVERPLRSGADVKEHHWALFRMSRNDAASAGTDIASSGIWVKVGIGPTTHKTVAMFVRYVHTEDKSVQEAAELVANPRKAIAETQHRVLTPHDPEADLVDYRRALVPGVEAQMKTPAQGRGGIFRSYVKGRRLEPIGTLHQP